MDSGCPPPSQAIPTPLPEVPKLTGDLGDQVRNAPGESRGAHRGPGAVGAWGATHLLSLLAWSKQPGQPGHL